MGNCGSEVCVLEFCGPVCDSSYDISKDGVYEGGLFLSSGGVSNLNSFVDGSIFGGMGSEDEFVCADSKDVQELLFDS